MTATTIVLGYSEQFDLHESVSVARRERCGGGVGARVECAAGRGGGEPVPGSMRGVYLVFSDTITMGGVNARRRYVSPGWAPGAGGGDGRRTPIDADACAAPAAAAAQPVPRAAPSVVFQF